MPPAEHYDSPPPDEPTDFNDLEQLKTKYTGLKLATETLKEKLASTTKQENKPAVEPANRPGKPIPIRKQKKVVEKEAEDNASGLTAEELTTLEQTRFGIWIAKQITWFLMGLTFLILVLGTIVGLKTNQIPDLSPLGSLFKHIQDIGQVIFKTGSD